MSAAKNLDDESSLEELAEAVMAGDDVDWDRLTNLLGPRHKGLLAQFQTVTRIMDANRAKATPVDDDGDEEDEGAFVLQDGSGIPRDRHRGDAVLVGHHTE